MDNQALALIVEAECSALHGFMALLREEQQALVAGKVENLAAYAEPKAKSLLELSRLGQTRNDLLARGGIKTNRLDIEEYVSEQPLTYGNLKILWGEFIRLAQSAEHLNRINGMLISTRLRSTQTALNTLLTAAQMPQTYGHDGSTISYRSRHSLGSA